MKINLNLKDIIGKGYKTFWKSRKRYLVVKGGRGSKKSRTSALKVIIGIMKYVDTNALIIRKTERTLKQSCYAELEWAINRLGVEASWKVTKSPLEMTYIPTNQKILFRGLDNPLKLTSITVKKGIINTVWIEEAYEITKEDDFNKIDLSIRGILPKGAFFQFIITFNPWNNKHWLKKRFFDKEDEDIEAITTNYMCNEFIGTETLKQYEKMKIDNPRRYDVEGLGNWGMSEGLIFNNWIECEFDVDTIKQIVNIKNVIGIDFGYSTDPLAMLNALIDEDRKEIYIIDEVYKKNLTNDKIISEIKIRNWQKEKIIADSSEPKSIEEIRRGGILRIYPAIKGQGSIEYGIKKVNEYKLFILPKCVNTLTEITSYVYDDKGKPIDMMNHLMDCLRYLVTYDNNKQKSVATNRKIIT
ncbi:PBSX family phage terminase large subunit [Streptobacillus moniliformis]|uniref:PBSX family phage terminase large subunit n=1 Tax=Streptobacillus moniliformis TaxID=34105 RepID=UPI0007E413F0|nr:PBSX family phage terminase large subunit [Streptobacillus moniliformis]